MTNYRKYYDEDYNSSIFVVTSEGGLIYNNDIDRDDVDDIRFVMLTNDTLNTEFHQDNTIFISVDWKDFIGSKYINPDVFTQKPTEDYTGYYFNRKCEVYGYEYAFLSWQVDEQLLTERQDSEEVKKDYNGYTNTQNIITNAANALNVHNSDQSQQRFFNELDSLDLYIPAVMAAKRAVTSFNGKFIHGFLPSAGQYYIISQYILSINNILRISGHSTLPAQVYCDNSGDYLKREWWTSNEASYSEAFAYYRDDCFHTFDIPNAQRKAQCSEVQLGEGIGIFPLFYVEL